MNLPLYYFMADVFEHHEPQTTIVLKKGEIQRLTMRVKHISLIHIVNKSSKFNIGLS